MKVIPGRKRGGKRMKSVLCIDIIMLTAGSLILESFYGSGMTRLAGNPLLGEHKSNSTRSSVLVVCCTDYYGTRRLPCLRAPDAVEFVFSTNVTSPRRVARWATRSVSKAGRDRVVEVTQRCPFLTFSIRGPIA